MAAPGRSCRRRWAKYLGGADKAGAQRAMQAMLGMVKLDIEGLKRAYEGKSAAWPDAV